MTVSSGILAPACMTLVNTIDERFQSFDLRIADESDAAVPSSAGGRSLRTALVTRSARSDTAVHTAHDLTDRKFRALFRALSPMVLQVSDADSGRVFVPQHDEHVSSPPRGFDAVLAQEWRNSVLEFAESTGAELETTHTPPLVRLPHETQDGALDTIAYIDRLGALARNGTHIVAQQALASRAHGLIREGDHAPNPAYWAALLWRRLMGSAVLDPGLPAIDGLRVYAHSLRGLPEGVAIVVINTSRAVARRLAVPVAAVRYTLRGDESERGAVRLNGRLLTVGADGTLPRLTGLRTSRGSLTFTPRSITFLACPDARHAIHAA